MDRTRGGTLGVAWYVGTRLDAAGLDALLGMVLQDAGVEPVLSEVPAGVEAVRRAGPDGDYLFVMNHGSEAAVLAADGIDLLTGEPWSPTTLLAGGGVAVIRR